MIAKCGELFCLILTRASAYLLALAYKLAKLSQNYYNFLYQFRSPLPSYEVKGFFFYKPNISNYLF
jgi:hypothetical protein